MADETNSTDVLIVDDEPMMRAVLKLVLESLGANVVGEAQDGKEAIERFQEVSPALTFLDIEMPVKNGFDALKEIMRIDANARVIMLTGNDNTSIAEACIAGGAADYIRKGQTPEQLMAELGPKLTAMKLV
jgi:two-component system, chemotaxis family, chemotaxis protein CheY